VKQLSLFILLGRFDETEAYPIVRSPLNIPKFTNIRTCSVIKCKVGRSAPTEKFGEALSPQCLETNESSVRAKGHDREVWFGRKNSEHQTLWAWALAVSSFRHRFDTPFRWGWNHPVLGIFLI